MKYYDIVIIGAGAIGSAAARMFSRFNSSILVLERESDVGEITSAANSAIVHSGYDPVPGSLKAEMNVLGNRLFPSMCEELDIELKNIGSLTVAVTDEETEILRALERRALQNGVPVQMLDHRQALEMEPNLTHNVQLALLAPTAGIVNTFELCVALMENAMDNGVELHLNEEVLRVKVIASEETNSAATAQKNQAENFQEDKTAVFQNDFINIFQNDKTDIFQDDQITVILKKQISFANDQDHPSNNNQDQRISRQIPSGETVPYRYEIETDHETYLAKTVINAAGLFADVLSNMICEKKYEIQPRKGEYFVLDHFDPDFVKHTIFSVPSSKGKGILVSPTTHGNYILGPSSEFVEHKDDYSTDSETLNRVMDAARKLVPGIPVNQIIRQFAGLRAVEKEGHFVIDQPRSGWINLLGIQSPGLTSCLAIANRAVEMAQTTLSLKEKNNWNPRRRPVIRLKNMSGEDRTAYTLEHPEFGNIVCRCEAVSEGEVLDCMRRNGGATTVRGVKKRVQPGFGKCQGGFCQPRIIKILARELNCPPNQIRYKGPESWILLDKTKQDMPLDQIKTNEFNCAVNAIEPETDDIDFEPSKQEAKQ